MKRPSRRRVRTARTIRLNVYEILRYAVERGVGFGVNGAFKHTEAPAREWIAEHVEREVMNALCEVVKFDDEAGSA